ncbi:TPA: hypothetical protein OMD55_003183 [Klebsiella michiganensis]|nr:hypothetical protein [Klebsiella oxytoca]MCE5369237.1 hypothetical protein [Klebsiella oxytoca]HBM3260473.1 hypothetical protein [Klebsiella oxytoca]HCQ8236550.1 hypothetical protein [Klebsiella michiganensis]
MKNRFSDEQIISIFSARPKTEEAARNSAASMLYQAPLLAVLPGGDVG